MKKYPQRIVNIYNFIRAIEPRVPAITPHVLYETTARQIQLMKTHRLPATFSLQYDALIDARYQELLRNELDASCEVGAWWEIVQPLVEKAGLTWRGRFPWDWHADVGFSTGYTPKERERLIDTYMRDFKAIFGAYPLTVGSWFIDTHSLGYMSDRYGIVASCNCKDQVGTDGYTLWGGYWNQGYYPSRRNVYIPAQTAEEQIPVPVFRMLGSDPIYQYDDGVGTACQKVISLEPVYGSSGADPKWVKWFFHTMAEEPCLAFAYAQAGQENSFTWKRMATGLTFQIELISALAAAGKISVQTLAQTGKWFRSQFAVTPSTAVTATQDWKNEGRQTVWYNSRFYRINLLREADDFRIRDIHLFDQHYPDPYLETPLASSHCRYDALPVMDGFHWSDGSNRAGIRLVELDGEDRHALRVGPLSVRETSQSEIQVSCPVIPCGTMEIHCREEEVVFHFVGLPETGRHALLLTWSQDSNVPFVRVDPQVLDCSHHGHRYQVICRHGHFESGRRARLGSEHREEGTSVLIIPDRETLILGLGSR